MRNPNPPKMQPNPELFEIWPRPIPDLSALRAEFAKDKETEDESLAISEAWTPAVSNRE